MGINYGNQIINFDVVKYIQQGLSGGNHCIKIFYIDNTDTTIGFQDEESCNDKFEKMGKELRK